MEILCFQYGWLAIEAAQDGNLKMVQVTALHLLAHVILGLKITIKNIL
jgi:hypothetical protein